MNLQKDYEIKPLVIRTESRIIDVLLMNHKAFTKTIEQSRLWYLHRDTGRVLPREGIADLIEIKSFSSWYEAVVSEPDKKEEEKPVFETDRESPAALRRNQDKMERTEPEAAYFQDPGFYPEQLSGPVLSGLEYTIRERLMTMPEGSYTTHLFASGREKIRKKTGEEAIEVLLADTPEQLIYEAADLLYHLSVLLVSENLSYEQVCSELQRRHLES